MFAVVSSLVFVATGLVTLGEGLSSTEPGSPARVAERFFSAPDLEERCGAAPGGIRLVAEPVSLSPGDALRMEALVIHAYDEQGNFVPAIPIEILGPDDSTVLVRERDAAGTALRAATEGSETLHARPVCGEAGQATSRIRISVSPEDARER